MNIIRERKRIITVQDLIDELILVPNKDAEINIVETNGTKLYNYYTPNLYDFSVTSYINDEKNSKVIIKMYR